VDRDQLIIEYVDLFVDTWNCQIDHEDGSTAPFSSLALEEVCSQ